jgi:CheY-like chemotaxis protein
VAEAVLAEPIDGQPIDGPHPRGGKRPALLGQIGFMLSNETTSDVPLAVELPRDDQATSEIQPRLLVAEDDPVFRRVITYTLRRAGYEVTAVADGERAWQALQSMPFAGLITDHQMPGGSGVELLERVRNSSLDGQLPSILCTAKGLELDHQYLLERFGLLTVLHKPFSPIRLVECLREHCPAA